MTWSRYKHPLGPAWTSDDQQNLILRAGSRFVLYTVGHTGLRGHYKTLDEAKAAAA